MPTTKKKKNDDDEAATPCETYMAVGDDEETGSISVPIVPTISDELRVRYPRPHPMRCAKHSWWYLTTKKPDPFPFRTTYLEYPPRPYPRKRCADPLDGDSKSVRGLRLRRFGLPELMLRFALLRSVVAERCAKHTWLYATTKKAQNGGFQYPRPHPMR